jgi:hypothetical protein
MPNLLLQGCPADSLPALLQAILRALLRQKSEAKGLVPQLQAGHQGAAHQLLPLP